MESNHDPSDDQPLVPRVHFGSYFEMHPYVFPAGALTIALLVLVCFLVPPETLQPAFEGIRDWIGEQFGWLYVLVMTCLLVFAVVLACSPWGAIRLGKDDERPEFSLLSWFAMLFSAGMGIGLLFYSVAEPTSHFQNPPPGLGQGMGQSQLAMAVTIYHWGLHPWALYAVVALALAYFGFRHERPLSFRSLLHPLFGDLVWGRLGDVVDTLTIISTLIGVATSLGIGAQQVNAGLTFLFGIPVNAEVQVLLIAGITAVATVSVCLGLDTGIRRLSEANMILAVVLMLFVIIAAGIAPFFRSVVENTGAYLQVLPFNSFRTGGASEAEQTWLNGWTVFFWAWWIAWSPFVGMFIARVSRGRTIREFILGVLLVPTLVCIVWLTAFGSTALRQHTDHVAATDAANSDDDPQGQGTATDASLPRYWVAELDEAGNPIVLTDGTIQRREERLTAVEYYGSKIVDPEGKQPIDTLATVMFTLIEGIFSSKILIVIAAGVTTLCIILFFVTSSDSASMVIDIIASGGNPNPPILTRLFWAISEGVVAAILLLVGGLQALQAVAIAAALPLTLILVLACIALVKALLQDGASSPPPDLAEGN